MGKAGDIAIAESLELSDTAISDQAASSETQCENRRRQSDENAIKFQSSQCTN